MSRVLLVNPWVYDFAAYDLWSKPLGLLYIAAFLRKYDFQVEYIDCMDRYHPQLSKHKMISKKERYGCGPYYAEQLEKPSVLSKVPRKYKRYGLPEQFFLEELKGFMHIDAALVTVPMTYWYPGAFRVIELIKEMYKNIPIIIGGAYPTLCYEHAVKHSGADVIFQGSDIYELVKEVDSITPGKSRITGFPKSFSDYIYPAYDLYNHLNYVAILTSRGCPFHCTYCASNLITPTFEQRDVKSVLEELIFYYRRRKIHNIAFYDDALLVNPEEHINPLLEEVLKKHIKVNFFSPNGLHARFLNKETADLMYRSGFKEPRLSLETSNPELQNKTGGKVNNEDLEKAIKCLTEAGYKSKEISVYLMIGLPEQTLKEVIDSICYVSSLGTVIRLAEYSPIMKTPEWDKLEFPIDLDPLLHNNTVYGALHIPNLQKIKNLVRAVNYGTTLGVNVCETIRKGGTNLLD